MKRGSKHECTHPSIVALYIRDKRIPRRSKTVETCPSTRACRFFEPSYPSPSKPSKREPALDDALKHGRLF